MIFFRILDALPVRGWKVIQEDDRLCLQLSGNAHQVSEQALVSTVRDALAELNAIVPEVVVTWVPDIERGSTGKVVRIVPTS